MSIKKIRKILSCDFFQSYSKFFSAYFISVLKRLVTIKINVGVVKRDIRLEMP